MFSTERTTWQFLLKITYTTTIPHKTNSFIRSYSFSAIASRLENVLRGRLFLVLWTGVGDNTAFASTNVSPGKRSAVVYHHLRESQVIIPPPHVFGWDLHFVVND